MKTCKKALSLVLVFAMVFSLCVIGANAEVENVASIGSTEYSTLAAAVAAATDKSTVALLKDASVDSMITLNKNLTLNLNGHKVSRSDGNSLVQVIDGKTLTIDGTQPNSEVYGRINLGVATNNNGNAVLNGGKYSCAKDQTVLHINGTCNSSNVTISGATITSPTDNGIQLNGSGTFLIENSTITGATAVYIKSGTLTLKNSTLEGSKAPVDYSYNGNGANATGDALVVDACNYPGGNPTVIIQSGSFTGTKAAVGYYQNAGTDNTATPGTANIIITGGTFNTDPTSYVANGYVVSGAGPYTVAAPYTSGPAPTTTPKTETTTTTNGTVTTETTTTTKTDAATGAVVKETAAVATDSATGTVTEVKEQTVTQKDGTSVAAKAETVKESSGQTTVAATVTTDGEATKVAVPEQTVEAIKEAAVSDTGTATLTVETKDAAVTFDDTAIKAIVGEGSKVPEKVEITAEAVDTAKLPETQKALVGDNPVINLEVAADGTKVSDFGGGTVTVSVAYTPKAGQDTSNIVVWYLADDGTLTPMECSYDASTGKINFKTGHFSKYIIGYFPFDDVAGNQWYYESVVYAFNHSLFSGTGSDRFSPNMAMSRAMLWSVLYRIDGGKTSADSASWYADAQKWMMDNKLSDGTNPMTDVTREQMVAMLYRYAQFKGYDVSVGEDTNILSYTDAMSITEYAIPAMQWACGAGVIQGSGNMLMPQGGAQRSQVAAILMRFAESASK